MSLRILVDLLFFTGTRGGTETYAREIVRRLPRSLADAQFVAVTNRAGAERVRAFFPGDVHVVDWVGPDRVSWAAGEILSVNRIARSVCADVVWGPANFGPLAAGRVARVTTTHDVTYHATDLKGAGALVPRITSWLMSRAARTSDAVITGSHAAEQAIRAHIDLDADIITVIPHGTSAPPTPANPWDELVALGIHPGRSLILSTGNRLPHKNFEAILNAVALMSDQPVVVIPGSHGQDPLVPLVARLGLDSDVVLPGWVTTAQLEALYAAASLYVCPSLAEGFGLPVLDAMARGCVVLANDIPVLREVGGDVALYADASDAVTFASAIGTAVASEHTERREAGRRRAAAFTWEISAERTAQVIESAARSRTGA